MKALVQHEYGPPAAMRLEERVRPVPGDDEVLVRVRAAGVNWADYSITTGIPFMVRLGFGLTRPRNSAAVRGTDVSGEVVEIGPAVTSTRVGDDVFGWCRGAFAEFASVPATDLVPKPENITHEQAAAVPMAGIVALQALRDVGEVGAGDRVLVIGASGGIGTFAVQIAKTMGAQVTGVCSTPNVDLVRSIGADRVVDYLVEDVFETDERYEFILDIADNRSLSDRRRLLKPDGVLVPNSGEGGRMVGSLGRIVGARLLSPFVSQKLHPFLSMPQRDDLLELKRLIEDDRIIPIVGRTYPLADAAAAVEDVGRRHSRGKTVVTI